MVLQVFHPFDPEFHATEEKAETHASATGGKEPRQLAKEKGEEENRGADNRHIRRDGDVRGDRTERSDQIRRPWRYGAR
jgi:hypothetical protein